MKKNKEFRGNAAPDERDGQAIKSENVPEHDLELFRDIFNQSNEAIYVIDPETGRFLNVNDKVCSDLGYSRLECLNLKISDVEALFTDEDSWEKHIIEIKRAGHILAEREHRRKDGSVFPVEVSANFIKHGEREYLVALARDLSERKELQEQLRHAQKMESVGTLAGGIAHEFNNILGIIIGYTELALGNISEGSSTNDYLKEVWSASLRAKDIVHQMLSFARRSPGDRKAIQLSSVINDTLKLLRATIPVSVEIVTRLLNKSDILIADPLQIREVLMNLCANSAYAMKDKGGILEIKLEDTVIREDQVSLYNNPASGNYFRLTVSDSGHGIDPKILDRIFDPYFTTKTVTRGTSGMGLAVVHGIVKANDGSIRIESKPGKGTVVEVFFPVRDLPEEKSGTERNLPRRSNTGERILFIDDEIQAVKLFKRLLERNGYLVTAKTDSYEALAAFKENPGSFDVVITDLVMPNLSGDELIKEIKTIRPDVPVIICTGYSDRMSEREAKEYGIDDFLTKPVTEELLTKALKHVLH